MNKELENYLNDNSINKEERVKIWELANKTFNHDSIVKSIRTKYWNSYEPEVTVENDDWFFNTFIWRTKDAWEKWLDTFARWEVEQERWSLISWWIQKQLWWVQALAWWLSAWTLWAVWDIVSPVIDPVVEKLTSRMGEVEWLNEAISETSNSAEDFLNTNPTVKAALWAGASLLEIFWIWTWVKWGKQLIKEWVSKADEIVKRMADEWADMWKSINIEKPEMIQNFADARVQWSIWLNKKEAKDFANIHWNDAHVWQWWNARWIPANTKDAVKTIKTQYADLLDNYNKTLTSFDKTKVPVNRPLRALNTYLKSKEKKMLDLEWRDDVRWIINKLDKWNISIKEYREIKWFYEAQLSGKTEWKKIFDIDSSLDKALVKDFSETAEKFIPNIKELNKEIRTYNLVLNKMNDEELFWPWFALSSFDDAMIWSSVIHPSSLAALSVKKTLESPMLLRKMWVWLWKMDDNLFEIQKADKAPKVEWDNLNIKRPENYTSKDIATHPELTPEKWKTNVLVKKFWKEREDKVPVDDVIKSLEDSSDDMTPLINKIKKEWKTEFPITWKKFDDIKYIHTRKKSFEELKPWEWLDKDKLDFYDKIKNYEDFPPVILNNWKTADWLHKWYIMQKNFWKVKVIELTD